MYYRVIKSYLEKISKQKSNSGSFQVKGDKVLFQRLGPLSSQKQFTRKDRKGHKPPVGRGIWAFPFPMYDSFLLAINMKIKCLKD